MFTWLYFKTHCCYEASLLITCFDYEMSNFSTSNTMIILCLKLFLKMHSTKTHNDFKCCTLLFSILSERY